MTNLNAPMMEALRADLKLNTSQGRSTGKLELLSFSDQLALANSGVVPRREEEDPATKSSTTTLDLSLKSLIDLKKTNQGLRRHSDPAPPRRIKSALKKISSYGIMEAIGENIPISTNKSNWKNLPVPKLAKAHSTDDRTTALLTARQRAISTPCLLPPSTCFSTAKPPKHNVSFSKIVIRDYDVTAGDGACTLGPPVALDWTYQENAPMDVLQYEQLRPIPRSKSEMHLNPSQRTMLLKQQAGLTTADVSEAAKRAQKTHQQRQATVQRLRLMKLEDLVESATRKAKRFTKLRRTSSLSDHPNDVDSVDASVRSLPASWKPAF